MQCRCYEGFITGKHCKIHTCKLKKNKSWEEFFEVLTYPYSLDRKSPCEELLKMQIVFQHQFFQILFEFSLILDVKKILRNEIKLHYSILPEKIVLNIFRRK